MIAFCAKCGVPVDVDVTVSSECPRCHFDTVMQVPTTVHEATTLVVRKLKDLHLEIAKEYGISADVIAAAQFGLGVTMMFECGSSEADLIGSVQRLVGDLMESPEERGAS